MPKTYYRFTTKRWVDGRLRDNGYARYIEFFTTASEDVLNEINKNKHYTNRFTEMNLNEFEDYDLLKSLGILKNDVVYDYNIKSKLIRACL